MTQTEQKLTVEVSKIISAPVEKVFKAWTEPEQLSKWLRGNLAVGTHAEQDVRIGGQYRIENKIGCDGKPVLITGTYKEIVPNKKLVFTWTHNSQEFPAKDTLVTVTFVAKGNSTEVIIKHTNFVAQTTADRHNMGWEACLENLVSLF